jgi:hypothetical protein
MSVDTNDKIIFGYKFDDNNKIDFYDHFKEDPKKCFEHDIPYDPDNNFDPKSGKKLWVVNTYCDAKEGYDEDNQEFNGLHIHTDPYSGNVEYIGEVLGYFTSVEELKAFDIDGLTQKIKDTLVSIGVTYREGRIGIYSFVYYS